MSLTLKTNMNSIVEINEENFETEVRQSSLPVLVDFWAPWCGPCKMLGPLLEEISNEQAARLKVVKVNVDESPGLAQRYNIQSVPTLLYFVDGAVRNQSIGFVSKKAIVSKLEGLGVTA
jgi:thioredoxin 1